MRTTFWKPLIVAVSSVAMVLAVLYIAYRWVDPLPPRHLTIAAGPAVTTTLRGNMRGCLPAMVSS
jgi:hypothetical protein